jgi:mannan endo-1,4-beta-mannosidase
LAGIGGAAVLGRQRAAHGEDRQLSVRFEPAAPAQLVSPLVFGTNDLGTMGFGEDSATLDHHAGISMRRLGGNAVSTYNWSNGCNNFGHDWRHANMLGVSGYYLREEAARRAPLSAPAAVHERALAIGARSLVQVPIGDFVAADADGVVTPEEAAPSPRWVPVSWGGSERTSPGGVVDMPRLVGKLVERYGRAVDGGVYAYALDNEPALWHETHPRAHSTRMPVSRFLERATTAAARIKAIDPTARVIGPSFWGSTAMVDFHDAPDWRHWRRYGTMVAAYLDTFRAASERSGIRLLDHLDIHWYAFSDAGNLHDTRDPALASAVLDAPRTLDEAGFIERSWVGRSLGRGSVGGLSLPILPSLQRILERWYPGTGLAVTEFNYGLLAESALATADALARFVREGVEMATLWGRLEPPLHEAYHLFRDPLHPARKLRGRLVPLVHEAAPAQTLLATRTTEPSPRYHLVVINRDNRPLVIDPHLRERRLERLASHGFDVRDRRVVAVEDRDRDTPLAVPPYAARHVVLA